MPNVLLVSVDTLNPTELRAYSSEAPARPSLDAFARESAVFRNALAPSAWTLPSHASLFTGLYPDRHGATDPRLALGASVPTLAAILREQGVETVGFTDGGYMDRAYGLASGFDRYDGWRRGLFAGWIPGLPRGGRPAEFPGAEPLFDRARAFLARRRPQDGPFLLFVHTHAVHSYFHGPDALDADARERTRTIHDRCLRGRAKCEAAVWRGLRALYRLEVGQLDRGFGALLEALRASGLEGSTLVILLSDHGEGFDPERRRIHHGGRLHADQLRVPLLVRGPGVVAGERPGPVSLVDMAPTVLDWLDVPIPETMDGISLAPVLRGEAEPPRRALYGMEHAFRWTPEGRATVPEPTAQPHALAVIEGDRWYIRSEEGEELYDVAEPEQGEDRTAREPNTAAHLRQAAAARGETVRRAAPVEWDEELADRLRALGYADAVPEAQRPPGPAPDSDPSSR